MTTQPILSVEALTTNYRADGMSLRGIKDISFDLKRGEILGIVGESGSGKSTLSFAISRLLPENAQIESGQIEFSGLDLTIASPKEMRRLRGDKIAMVFQDPLSSLHPCLTIGRQMVDALRAHNSGSRKEYQNLAADMLARVGIGNTGQRLRQYPHELSGGMRQRVMIAIALLLRPDLLIADEPTSALDVSLQGQIIGLLAGFREKLGTSVLIISHDLTVISSAADFVLVMYAGESMELANAEEIFRHPLHPYTQSLISVMPDRRLRGKPLPTIPGRVPSAHETIVGCAFAGRCPQTRHVCSAERPQFSAVGLSRVRCHIYDPQSGWLFDTEAEKPAAAR
ncbi:ABC transporter ATP-binding protein [Phyllobacterium sp. SB3]|uniref:ABC transporter ATP-binding protein n=1 Tax=Phyllobacterium sp. SB3 TaxID=3156073 RepID=UPI0032AE9A2A